MIAGVEVAHADWALVVLVGVERAIRSLNHVNAFCSVRSVLLSGPALYDRCDGGVICVARDFLLELIV